MNLPSSSTKDSMATRRICAPHKEQITSGICEGECLSDAEVIMANPPRIGFWPSPEVASRGLTPKDTVATFLRLLLACAFRTRVSKDTVQTHPIRSALTHQVATPPPQKRGAAQGPGPATPGPAHNKAPKWKCVTAPDKHKGEPHNCFLRCNGATAVPANSR